MARWGTGSKRSEWLHGGSFALGDGRPKELEDAVGIGCVQALRVDLDLLAIARLDLHPKRGLTIDVSSDYFDCRHGSATAEERHQNATKVHHAALRPLRSGDLLCGSVEPLELVQLCGEFL